jgi:hypothetical protein
MTVLSVLLLVYLSKEVTYYKDVVHVNIGSGGRMKTRFKQTPYVLICTVLINTL